MPPREFTTILPLSLQTKSTSEKVAWAKGCDRCNFGVLNQVSYSNSLPLYLAKLALYRSGALDICDCAAGASLVSRLMKLDAAEEDDKQLIERLARDAAEHKRQKLFSDAGVPPTFADLTMKSYVELAAGDEGKAAAIAAIREYHDKGETGGRPGILLWGESGVGKTGALSPLFMSLLRKGFPGLWIQYNELMAELRKFDEGNVEERISAVKHTEYLLIDDLGDPVYDSVARPWTREVMFRIIDYRCNYRKPTFITTNMNVNDFDSHFRVGMVKRLAELCAIIQVTGKKLGAVSAIQF